MLKGLLLIYYYCKGYYLSEDFDCAMMRSSWSHHETLECSHDSQEWKLIGSQFSLVPLYVLLATLTQSLIRYHWIWMFPFSIVQLVYSGRSFTFRKFHVKGWKISPWKLLNELCNGPSSIFQPSQNINSLFLFFFLFFLLHLPPYLGQIAETRSSQ